MLFDEVTSKPRTLSLHEIYLKLKEFKENEGNLNIIFDFGPSPIKIEKSDYPNEYFLNYSNEESTLNRLLNQMEKLEEDLFIYTNYDEVYFDTEVLVGVSETYDTSSQNISILDIILDDNKIIIETDQNFNMF